MTGFPPGIVNRTIHVNDTTAEAGETALAIAYNNAAGRTGAFTPAVGNIGGLTFTPGLYRSGTSTAISGGGNLTLDAEGDPNAVFIFQIASTLTTSSGFGITLMAEPSSRYSGKSAVQRLSARVLTLRNHPGKYFNNAGERRGAERQSAGRGRLGYGRGYDGRQYSRVATP